MRLFRHLKNRFKRTLQNSEECCKTESIPLQESPSAAEYQEDRTDVSKTKYEGDIDELTDHWLQVGVEIDESAKHKYLFSGQKHPTAPNFDLMDVVKLTGTGIWLSESLWYAKEYCDTADFLDPGPKGKLIFCATIVSDLPMIKFPADMYPAEYLHTKKGFNQQADVFVSRYWDSIVENLSQKDEAFKNAIGHFRFDNSHKKLGDYKNHSELKEVWVANPLYLTKVEKRKALRTKKLFTQLYGSTETENPYLTFKKLTSIG
jgi:hypothetical protein